MESSVWSGTEKLQCYSKTDVGILLGCICTTATQCCSLQHDVAISKTMSQLAISDTDGVREFIDVKNSVGFVETIHCLSLFFPVCEHYIGAISVLIRTQTRP